MAVVDELILDLMETHEEKQLDLVGTFEAHLILGVERSRLARWLTQNDQGLAKVPEPVARLRSGPVWFRSQIEDKLRDLYDEAGAKGGLEKWAVKRSLARAKQLKPAMPASELSLIIARPVRAR